MTEPGGDDNAPAGAVTPSLSVAAAATVITRSCLGEMNGAAKIFHNSQTPDHLHQIRVGLRRLRTALKIFRPAITPARWNHAMAELKWLAGELNDARDIDVFAEDSFAPARADLTARKPAALYAEKIKAARAAAYARAVAALDCDRFGKFVSETAAWLEAGVSTGVDDLGQRALLAGPIGPFAGQVLDRLALQVRKRGKHLTRLSALHRHKLRIRAKRLRYASEFFAHAFGKGGGKKRRAFGEALKALQTTLGHLNDLAQAGDQAQAVIGPGASRQLTFIAGELTGRAEAGEPDALKKAEDAFVKFKKAKRFWPAA